MFTAAGSHTQRGASSGRGAPARPARSAPARTGRLARALAPWALAGLAAPLEAGERGGDLLENRFTISAGTFLLEQRTGLRLSGSAGNVGTEIDLERDLGFRDSNRFRLDATWRFAPRHRLRALYFNNDQSSRRVLERDLQIGDSFYPARVELAAGVGTQIAELAYEYLFVARPHLQLSASAGVHAVEFEFTAAGQASIAGQSGQFREERAVADAPLPVLGLRGLWEFAPRWYLDGQLQSFSLSMDGFDGRLTDLRVGVIRMLGEHVGVGLGWNRFDVDVETDREDFTGSLDWRYDGAMLFLTVTF